MSSPWKCSVDQKQLAPKTMQLAVVMTEESRVISREFGAEVLKGLNPLISHPGTELLAGAVGEGITQAGLGRFSGDGLQPQASAGVQVHGEQRLAAAESSAWGRSGSMPSP